MTTMEVKTDDPEFAARVLKYVAEDATLKVQIDELKARRSKIALEITLLELEYLIGADPTPEPYLEA